MMNTYLAKFSPLATRMADDRSMPLKLTIAVTLIASAVSVLAPSTHASPASSPVVSQQMLVTIATTSSQSLAPRDSIELRRELPTGLKMKPHPLETEIHRISVENSYTR